MGEKTNIQVGEPLSCQIDYSLSEKELGKYFDSQMALVRNGQEELSTVELMMLGYALDFISFAKNAAHVDINFGEESLERFDAVLEAVHVPMLKGELPGNQFYDIVKSATGFFGVFLFKNIGGSWVQTNIGPAVRLKETNAFIYNRVVRRIQNGKKDDIISFYNTLKSM